ncbi:MAG: A/G-specific adenine glycosylase [Hyphomonadaceae bacterium]|nr:A/G-specific adenine glycosylase [Hyphomonadaceae bacterium]
MPAPVRKLGPLVEKERTTRDKRRKSLLSWYDQHARQLPWRVRGGGDPYRVWLSEVMLQQTTVTAVTPYFERFVARWPTIADLAAAPREEVLAAWAGLGYYARARNLHAAAQLLVREGFPETEVAWRAVPGVGAYTAAAIAAIALDLPANVVDGNVERVMARLHAIETPLPAAKVALRDLAGELVTSERPGDWAQALMDLGATVCTPKAPRCDACPLSKTCAAFAAGASERYPRRLAKAERPRRYGVVYRIERDGAIWLVRRPEKGLLAGMAALPTSDWRDSPWGAAEAIAQAPAHGAWRKLGAVRHVFTHFALTLDVYAAAVEPSGEGWWGDADALPTVFKKAALAVD